MILFIIEINPSHKRAIWISSRRERAEFQIASVSFSFPIVSKSQILIIDMQKQESTESENSEGQVENIGKDIEQLEPIG